MKRSNWIIWASGGGQIEQLEEFRRKCALSDSNAIRAQLLARLVEKKVYDNEVRQYDSLISSKLIFERRVEVVGSVLIETDDADAVHDELRNRHNAPDPPEEEAMSRRERIADGILIFASSSPDDAEAAVGDLMENFDKVSSRHSAGVSALYFAWELTLLVLTKTRQRMVNSTIGPLLNRWFKGSAS